MRRAHFVKGLKWPDLEETRRRWQAAGGAESAEQVEYFVVPTRAVRAIHARVSREPAYTPEALVVHSDWVDQLHAKGQWVDPKAFLVDLGSVKPISKQDLLVDYIETAKRPHADIQPRSDSEETDVSEDGRASPGFSSSSSPFKHRRVLPTEESTVVCMAPTFRNVDYVCQREHPLHAPFNHKLIALLEEIVETRRLLPSDGWDRSQQYLRAISNIKAYPREITSVIEVQQMAGIGKKIRSVVHELLKTGTHPMLEEARRDPRLPVLRQLSKAYAVGPATALQWYHRGVRTIEDALALSGLQKQQEVGLKYFKDLTTPIPRATVEKIAALVLQHLQEMDAGFTCEIVGGYRRGKTACGDVDLLISHPNEGREHGIINDITDRLKEKGIVQHVFNAYRPPDPALIQGKRHASGHFDALEKAYVICVVPGEDPPVYRQLDLIVAPRSQYGTAMLGWSGNTQYERSLRSYADKVKGAKFASHGLFVGPHRDQRLTFEHEEQVLAWLDLPNLPPHLRNC